MIKVGNLYINLGVIFELSLTMAEVGILNSKLSGYFMYFSYDIYGWAVFYETE